MYALLLAHTTLLEISCTGSNKLFCTFLQVKIHPSSVNFQVGYFESPYLVYHEKVKTTRVSCDTNMLQCSKQPLYYFLASGDFCPLLTAFANSLDPDQDQLNVGPDLDPNKTDTDSVPECFLLKKSADEQKSMKNCQACRVNAFLTKHLSAEVLKFQYSEYQNDFTAFAFIDFELKKVLLPPPPP